MIKKVLLFLWQLPQNILGFIIALFLVDYEKEICRVNVFIHYKTWLSSFSLGYFIFINGYCHGDVSVKHEKGHSKQSLYLGIFYILLIGIPSLLGNIYDKLFHKKWTTFNRLKWYYNLPWEKWADKLGDVKRNYIVEECFKCI